MGRSGQGRERALGIGDGAEQALLDGRQELPIVQHQHFIEQQYREIGLLVHHGQITVDGELAFRSSNFQRVRSLVERAQAFHQIKTLVIDRLAKVGFDAAVDFRQLGGE